jgi:hypothetical protein
MPPVVKLSTYGRDFSMLARSLALGDPATGGADGYAARHGASAKVVEVLRSGVAAANTATGNWGVNLLGDAEGYAAIVADFTATLTAGSAFFRLLNSGALATVPAHSEVAVVTTDITSVLANLGEGKPMKMGAMVIGRDKIEPSKAACLMVASESLLKAAPTSGGLFEKQLR